MLVGAELQQITYQELLPIVLGSKALGNLAKTETVYEQNVRFSMSLQLLLSGVL